MRDPQTHTLQPSGERQVDVSAVNEQTIASAVKVHLSGSFDARLVLRRDQEKLCAVTVEELSSVGGYGLVYRIAIEPGKEKAVESFSGKKVFDVHDNQRRRTPVAGVVRLVGSNSQHWIGEAGFTLPHLGEIEYARNELCNSRIMGPPNPFSPNIFRDCGDTLVQSSQWEHGHHVASLALGSAVAHSREINEDAVLTRLLPESGSYSASWLFVVADGMGGHGGGQAAASSVVRTFASADLAEHTLDQLSEPLLRDLQQLYSEVHSREQGGAVVLVSDDMGAPFAAVRVFESSFQAVRAGDCRIALFSPRSEGYYCKWHSIDEGEGAIVRNPVSLRDGVASDLQLEQVVHPISPRDYLIIATDGLWKQLDLAQVAEQLDGAANAEEAEINIRQAVELQEKLQGVSDNRGIVVYRHAPKAEV